MHGQLAVAPLGRKPRSCTYPHMPLCWHSMETLSDSPPAPPAGPGQGNSWTMPLLLAAMLALAATLWLQFQHRPAREDASSAAAGWSVPLGEESQSVSLAVDFGNGARREFAALPYRKGMTIADLLKMAAGYRPSLRYTQRGDGEFALLTSLDGVTNGTPADRFWLYEVNGQPGKVSFALHELAAGDRVLWAFKAPE